ncbi:hypothetical protein VMCG_03290 [Cytospora schulzeri]|uniref:Uncharacterized protein n=1 Tax=Cytospora schulzeri TaxID=448051 RepID=A0A423WY83_9PEZI|nr:hypothetical protein VMCG_03290 [Valsa malicola]
MYDTRRASLRHETACDQKTDSRSLTATSTLSPSTSLVILAMQRDWKVPWNQGRHFTGIELEM